MNVLTPETRRPKRRPGSGSNSRAPAMTLSTYVNELIEGRIDFAGQALVEQIARFVLIGTTIVSFIVGFALQSLSVTFGLFGASTILLVLVTLPPWSMFNAHPVKWLPPKKSSNS